MTVQDWKEIIDQSIALVGVADAKAALCITITLCVSAGVLRMMAAHAQTLSNREWFLAYLPLSVMAIAVMLGIGVTYARGGIIMEQREGLQYFRTGHTGTDADFHARAERALPADLLWERRQLARDYFKILHAKFQCLTSCQGISGIGWGLAGAWALFVLQSMRRRARLGESVAPDEKSEILPATNGSSRSLRVDLHPASHAISSRVET